MKKVFLLSYVFALSFLLPKVSSGQTISNWYHQWQAIDGAGIGSGILYSWITYPDSNIQVPSSWYGGTAQNVSTHGMGFSFDPTDHSYSYNGSYPVLPPMPDTGQSYTVDSFTFGYDYVRNNPSTTVVDSMIIELTRTTTSPTTDSGVYNLIFGTYAGPIEWTEDLYTGYGPDNTPRYCAAILDTRTLKDDCLDSVKLASPAKVRIAVPLTHSFHHETATSGVFDSAWNYTVSLGTPINVKPLERLVAYVYFKSGVTYALNTSAAVANFLVLYAGNPVNSGGTPFGQTPSNTATGYTGSYNCGLICNNEDRYGEGGGYYFDSHSILIPANAYYYDPGFETPYMGFHVKYTCETPVVGSITGASAVSIFNSIRLTDTVAGGVWSASNPRLNTTASDTPGVVWGIGPGTDTVTYTMTNSCGASVSASKIITVSALAPLCAGNTDTLYPTPDPYGDWSSSNPSVATANNYSGGGVITGIAPGTAIITYITYGFYGVLITDMVTVITSPAPGAITGTASVCAGATTALSNALPGGTWSSNNTAVATIGTTGLVSGVSGGTATISYIVSNSCGSGYAAITLTVNPLPAAGTITGASSVCPTAMITLSDAISGGVWSSGSTGVATVSSGIVTGVAAGTALISYSVTTVCGTAHTTIPITVNPLPNAGIIAGPSSVCPGATVTLTDAVTGGVWTLTGTGVATIGGGTITGVAAGTTTVSYAVTTVCGTAYVTLPLTVNPLPEAGTISGPSSVCAGAAITLSDAVSGGVWSSGSTSIASVTTGTVTGVAAGATLISYAVANVCGTAYATSAITVNPLPNAGTITGASSVCPGAVITLADAVTGGVWNSSDYLVAAVSGTGAVNGVVAGTAVISYEVTTACGSATTTATITVKPLPVAGTITGPPDVCKGSEITLGAVTGGLWSATNINAFVSGGVVNGSVVGADTINYSVSNTCGTAVASFAITINPQPAAGTITGPDTVCAGNIANCTDTVADGVWSTTNNNAFVSATGALYGITQGADSILYTVSNSCGTSVAGKLITVGDCVSGVNNVGAQQDQVFVFPNPASTEINLRSETPITTVVISNLVGQRIFSGTYDSKEVVISLQQFPDGIYTVRVNGTYVFKVVKQ